MKSVKSGSDPNLLPDRGTLAPVASLVALFPGGAAIGATLAEAFAPESFLVAAVSFFALPVAFALGLQAWFGVALFRMMFLFIGQRWRARSGQPLKRVEPSIPGSMVFLPLSSAAGATAGAVAGLLSTTASGWLTWLVYWAVGTLHGLVAWRLARAGYLVPPESI